MQFVNWSSSHIPCSSPPSCPPLSSYPTRTTPPPFPKDMMSLDVWNKIISLSQRFLVQDDDLLQYNIMKSEIQRVERSLGKRPQSADGNITATTPDLQNLSELTPAVHAALGARLAVLAPSSIDFHRIAKKYYTQATAKPRAMYFSKFMRWTYPALVPAILIVLKYALWSEDVRDEKLQMLNRAVPAAPSCSDALLITIIETLKKTSSKYYECPTERANLVDAIRGIQQLRQRVKFPAPAPDSAVDISVLHQKTDADIFSFSADTPEIYIPSIYTVITAWDDKLQLKQGDCGARRDEAAAAAVTAATAEDEDDPYDERKVDVCGGYGGPGTILAIYLMAFPHTSDNVERFIKVCHRRTVELRQWFGNGKLRNMPTPLPMKMTGTMTRDVGGSGYFGSSSLLGESWDDFTRSDMFGMGRSGEIGISTKSTMIGTAANGTTTKAVPDPSTTTTTTTNGSHLNKAVAGTHEKRWWKGIISKAKGLLSGT